MPKYLKDTKLEYWRMKDGGVDDEGVWQPSIPEKMGDLWANFKGVDFTEYYAIHATWANPVFMATFTRPGYPVKVGDYIYHKGGYYRIKSINDLTGEPHTDMRVTVQYDPNEQKTFSKVER